MSKIAMLLCCAALCFLVVSCGKNTNTENKEANMISAKEISERVKAYAPTTIKVDMSSLSERDKQLIKILVDAGKIADEIFWQQTSYDAIAVRDSLKKINTPEAKNIYEYVMINYGPYDRIYESQRFFGKGPAKRPLGGTYYPPDMTKEEFEKYIKENPAQKEELESQYTVVLREGKKFKAYPFHQAYPLVEKLAAKLEEAAQFADNPTLKNYLILRAKALRSDDYFESDMAWMDIKDCNIDLVIGPIENYEDGIFNYKTAYEAVIMVKDPEATKDLEMFNSHVVEFEQKLPYDKKYIRSKVGTGTQINFMNVVYFGGDCQKGTKTIAASLPNDPKVRDAKGGGKNNMYKNMMEAKFDKIVVPIAQKILDPSIANLADKKAFIGFVTLHEISHTLGRGFVYGNDQLSVRKAMKDRYSAIEETKADILGMYNQKHLMDGGIYTKEFVKRSMVTYLAGLYRSIRFGAEEAHGISNLIQLNFLMEKGAIVETKDGKLSINEGIFFDKVAELAKLVLTVEAEGNYDEAGRILNKYGKMNPKIQKIIDSLKEIPRDLDTKYEL